MGIHLSKKHGVNSSIEICAVCGKEIGVALLGITFDITVLIRLFLMH